MSFLRRTWAEIDTAALLHNFKTIKSRTGAKIFSVVKANAYGHTTNLIAPALDRAGTDYFAVSNLEEAKDLRALGIKKPILILGYTPSCHAAELAKFSLTQTVFSLSFAKELNAAAKNEGVSLNVHLKLDTGMGRIGFDFRNDDFDGLALAKEALLLPALSYEGVFTHFPVADTDEQYTKAQFERFIKAVHLLEENSFKFEIKHCCNSAAFLNYPEMHLDAVRPGIILYGLTPDKSIDLGSDFIPVMTLKSVISQIKDVKKGETVSYGRTYTYEKDCRIATITAGYADGIIRLQSGKGRVLINGQFAPIVGRVCMDQLVVDVSEIDNVKEGDSVTFFGKELPAEEFADKAETINYEVVCSVSKRVPRIPTEK